MTKLSSFRKGIFCAWDGEGATINGKHEYILLMNNHGGRLQSTQGLSTSDCFDFLLNEAEKLDSRTIHVCFGANYDVNMMLRDVPALYIQRLHEGKNVWWKKYQFSYRRRKEFMLKKMERDSHGQFVCRGKIRLWDVFGYFQCRFVDALGQYLGADYPQDLLDVISQQKENRSQFDPGELDQIAYYCGLEVDALHQMMVKLRDYLVEADLPVGRWDGAGSIAAQIYARHQVRRHIPQTTPLMVQQWARFAYSGGRIETVRVGKGGPIHAYDINSAYPAAMIHMPSLIDGQWEEVDEYEPASFGMWEVCWRWRNKKIGRQTSPIMPFFYRLPNGNIRYPAEGHGIYWTPEVDSALEVQERHKDNWMRIKKGWIFRPSNPDEVTYPFDFVQQLYDLRQLWKTAGEPAEKVLKLGINSLYGKTAQQLGGHKDKKPPYHCLEYAGYITSFTRAQLFYVASQAPDQIVFLATDGIASLTPLECPIGKSLGQWSYKEYNEIVAVEAGVYWYRKDEELKAFYRGYDREQLQSDKVLTAWERGDLEMKAPATRFISMGSALASPEKWKTWRTWPPQERTLSLVPQGKRMMDPEEEWNPHQRLVPTQPALVLTADSLEPILSAPFKVRWEMEEGVDEEQNLQLIEEAREYEDTRL